MKVLLTIILLMLTGCGKSVICIEGRLWTNINPLQIGNIYTPTSVTCIDKDELK